MLRIEVDPAALPGRAAHGAGDGLAQPGVAVADDQADTAEAALTQRAQELGSEHLVLAVADLTAQHFTSAVGGHAGGDDDDGW